MRATQGDAGSPTKRVAPGSVGRKKVIQTISVASPKQPSDMLPLHQTDSKQSPALPDIKQVTPVLARSATSVNNGKAKKLTQEAYRP